MDNQLNLGINAWNCEAHIIKQFRNSAFYDYSDQVQSQERQYHMKSLRSQSNGEIAVHNLAYKAHAIRHFFRQLHVRIMPTMFQEREDFTTDRCRRGRDRTQKNVCLNWVHSYQFPNLITPNCRIFAYVNTKVQIGFQITRQLISPCIFHIPSKSNCNHLGIFFGSATWLEKWKTGFIVTGSYTNAWLSLECQYTWLL